jgi:undecaprenyl-diphosphatase
MLIGFAQAFALIPGVSRSGSTITMALFLGYRREHSARFSFLLATPIIGAAALLKVPEIFTSSAAPMRTAIIAGSLSAAVAAYFSVKFLMKYFQTKTLTPFAIYCAAAGIIFSLYFLTK